MPVWLVFGLMGVWAAGGVLALWQHFKPGLVFYILLLAGLIWLSLQVH